MAIEPELTQSQMTRGGGEGGLRAIEKKNIWNMLLGTSLESKEAPCCVALDNHLGTEERTIRAISLTALKEPYLFALKVYFSTEASRGFGLDFAYYLYYGSLSAFSKYFVGNQSANYVYKVPHRTATAMWRSAYGQGFINSTKQRRVPQRRRGV